MVGTKFVWLSIAALVLAGFGGLAIIGCDTGRAVSMPSVQADESTEFTEDQPPVVAAGARLWAQNCIRCHNIRTPASLSDRQWQIAMHHMRVRANLTAEEHDAILKFLKAAN